MLLFVFFAMLVWYGSFVGRRRLGGLAALGAGLFVLFVVNAVHFRVAQTFGYEQYVPVFRVLLYPYTALVASIGIFMISLPIDLPRGEIHCKACRYDLTEIKQEVLEGDPCPECGSTIAEASTRRGRRSARKRRHARSRLAPEPMLGLQLDSQSGSAADQSDEAAGDEHEQRQAADEQPLDRSPAGGVHGLDDRQRSCIA